MADAITRFAGTLRFVYLQAAVVGGWILCNVGILPGVHPFDPFPFVMLAVLCSIEAIFLATLVLITQNRMAEIADRRADLDLQINLLAEHEVTKLLGVVDAIATKLQVDVPDLASIDTLREEVEPQIVLEEIEQAEEDVEKRSRGDDPDEGPPSFWVEGPR